MTHAGVPAETRKQVGIEDDLIRLSIGVEAVADILGDLNNALGEAAKGVSDDDDDIDEDG